LRVERILGALVILEFTADAAWRYAVIKATLQRLGRPAGDCDVLVAAIALANGELLLTRNPRHFASMPGLAVLDY
jgi:predicted nucleic acid-binding protein